MVPGEDGLYFVVNAAWCKTGRGYADYLETVELLAKQSECVGIRFSTTRVGYPRFAKRYGYHVEAKDGDRIYFQKKLVEAASG